LIKQNFHTLVEHVFNSVPQKVVNSSTSVRV